MTFGRHARIGTATVKAYRTFRESVRHFQSGIKAVRTLCRCNHTRDCLAAGVGYTLAVSGGPALRSIAAMIFACALASTLGACTGGNFSTPLSGTGEWKLGHRADRVADEPIQSAGLTTRSRNTKAERNDPAVPQNASLQLICFDGEPVVRFYFTHEVGSDRNSRLTYKFDNKPAAKPNARILQDFQTVMLEDKKDVVTFANDLREAKKLDITVSGLVSGNTVAEFNVEGGAAAIEASYKTCPLPAAPPPRAPARRAKGA
jgi:hypothetical protein